MGSCQQKLSNGVQRGTLYQEEVSRKESAVLFCVIKAGIYKVKMEIRRSKRKSRWERTERRLRQQSR